MDFHEPRTAECLRSSPIRLKNYIRLVRPMTTRELLHQSVVLAGLRILLAERARNM